MFKKGPSESEKDLEISKEHISEFERKVGQLTYEVDWLKKNLNSCSDPTGRRKLVDFSDSSISIKRQAELLDVNRSSLYRDPPRETTVSEVDLDLIINRKKVHRMMRDMGVYTIYPKPNVTTHSTNALFAQKSCHQSTKSGLGY